MSNLHSTFYQSMFLIASVHVSVYLLSSLQQFAYGSDDPCQPLSHLVCAVRYVHYMLGQPWLQASLHGEEQPGMEWIVVAMAFRPSVIPVQSCQVMDLFAVSFLGSSTNIALQHRGGRASTGFVYTYCD